MKHLLNATVLFFLLVQLVQAQETMRFTLTEAQEYAIEHNKTLKDARLNIDLSERKLKETVAQGLPQVEASLDWMTYFGYEMEFNFGASDASFTNEQITNAMNTTMANYQGIPGVIDPVTQQDFYVFGAMQAFQSELQKMLPPTTIKMTDASTAKLQIGQLLFSGQYWTGIKVAKLGKEIATRGLENSILDIKEAVTNSYLMALITAQTIETFRKTIDNLNTIKGHTQNMYTAGLAEQTDVDQISIQVTMLENNLRSMERGQQMIESMLKFQLGLSNKTQIELTQNLESVMAGINPMSQPGNFDINNNPTWQLLETQQKISEKMIDMQKWTYAPTITGFYAYNQKLLTTGFDMTPNNMAGITMSLPVFSSGSRNHKLAQARIEYDKTLLSKSMVEDQLQIQYKQLVLDLNTAAENYESQKENVQVARRVYDNIQRKYEQGMASSLDLTQSNNNYIQAESNFIQATLSLLQAKVALDKLFNQL